MYSTCTFCNKSLGENHAIEAFPVGRRIAFDAARGRLWVICKSCERWNLSPLEERWEIVESCEREFSNTRIRTSTENIGLAKLPEGLELVRIGSPMRPEFAAWRYGDQFGRRRNKAMLKMGGGIVGLGAVYLGLTAFGLGGFLSFYFLSKHGGNVLKGNPKEIVATFPATDAIVKLKRKDLERVSLIATQSGWGLQVPDGKNLIFLKDDDALNAARIILPSVNRMGGSRRDVSEAVSLLEASGPSQYVNEIAHRDRWSSGALPALPFQVRLALEMATHEDVERRALEGELSLLEAAWRNAEEIADISDNMFTDTLRDRIAALGRK